MDKYIALPTSKTSAEEFVNAFILKIFKPQEVYVSIGEFPSDEVAMTFALGLGSSGNVRATTLKAFTKEEFAEMGKKLS